MRRSCLFHCWWESLGALISLVIPHHSYRSGSMEPWQLEQIIFFSFNSYIIIVSCSPSDYKAVKYSDTFRMKGRQRMNKEPSKRNVKLQSHISEGLWQQQNAWNKAEVIKGSEEKVREVSQALAAGESVASLPICCWRNTYIHNIIARRILMSRSVWYLLLWHNTVNFCKTETGY